jgi:protein phosphatase
MATGTNNATNTSRSVAKQSAEVAMGYATQFHWTSAALSDVGLVRQLNEDSCLDQPERGLWAVADGMGGHARGDLASRMVIEALNTLPPPHNLTDSIAAARDQLLAVNHQLRLKAANQHVSIIGSTVVTLIAFDRYCACLWAGDSRIYLYRDGKLTQLTRDHSQIEELKSLGNLHHDMLVNYPARNLITRAVGAHDNLALDEKILEVNDGDMFMLCSDGLSNEVTNQEISIALASGECLLAAEALLNMALMRGGHDNISIVVVRAEDMGTNEKTVVNPLL